RRHTRSKRDWSSDVCSSDLVTSELLFIQCAILLPLDVEMRRHVTHSDVIGPPLISHNLSLFDRLTDFKIIERVFIQMPVDDLIRSEERRVGKECKCRRGQ